MIHISFKHPAAFLRTASLALLLVLAGTVGSTALAQATATSTNPQPVSATKAEPGAGVPGPQPAYVDQDDDESDDQADNRWPMRFDIPQGQLTVYQPQLTGFDGNTMKGRAAVSILQPGSQEPVFGAIWLQSRVLTDRAAREVKIIDVSVTRVRIPGLEESATADAQAKPTTPAASSTPGAAAKVDTGTLSQALTDAFKREPMTMSLDQLLTMVEQVKKEHQTVKELDDTPPKIVFVNQPTVLVQFDGQPKFVQSNQKDLLQAANTPFFVVLDSRIKRYYLKGAGKWYIARNAAGPYLDITTVPEDVVKLADATGYQDPEAELAQAQAQGQLQTPAVITATEPTELIWTDGVEELTPIQNTNLLYVSNTDSDVVLDIDSQQIYVLLSGRWYRSASRSGPWTYVAPDKLPADFALIPPDSEKGSVLAHVAGTQMAKDALADNFVPQTATIDRNNYQQPTVEYDGDPQFEPVTNTAITYAVNTPNAVLFVGGRYYTCYNAVWYQSAAAVGPWVLCTSVPNDIYLLPPTCPVYPVRYVRIYEVTPSYICTGYLPGYVGSYVHQGVVVYGTGYRYHSWYRQRYFPRPCTWGYSARYDPYRSYWGFDVGVNINFGNGVSLWFGSANTYVPARAVWFGYGGYRPAYFHHPRYNHYDRIYNQRQAYRAGYRQARDDSQRHTRVRRTDLNLYERRHDVIDTRTPGRRPLDRDQRQARQDNPTRQDRAFGRDGRQASRSPVLHPDDNAQKHPRADQQLHPSATAVHPPTDVTLHPGDKQPDMSRPGRSASRSRQNRDNDRNNIYADENGNVYRKTLDGWEQREQNHWVPRTTITRNGRGAADNNTPAGGKTPAAVNPGHAITPGRATTPGRANSNPHGTLPERSTQQPRVNHPQPNQSEVIHPGPNRSRSANPQAVPSNPRSTSNNPRATPVNPATPAAPSTPESGQRGHSMQQDRGSTGSLNADYRARIMGAQRQQMYNRSQDHVRAAPPPSPAPTPRPAPAPSRAAQPAPREAPAAAPASPSSRRESSGRSSGSSGPSNSGSSGSSGGSSREGGGHGGRGH
jgi:hypothetical protein